MCGNRNIFTVLCLRVYGQKTNIRFKVSDFMYSTRQSESPWKRIESTLIWYGLGQKARNSDDLVLLLNLSNCILFRQNVFFSESFSYTKIHWRKAVVVWPFEIVSHKSSWFRYPLTGRTIILALLLSCFPARFLVPLWSCLPLRSVGIIVA